MMRHFSFALLSALTLGPMLTAQTPNPRAQIIAVIERRLQTQQPIDLGADSITLTGKLLHLKGHARIVWLPDTVIRVEEVRIDAGTVELVGDVNVTFGSSSGARLTPPPKIEYR